LEIEEVFMAKIYKPKETFLSKKWMKEFDVTNILMGVILISVALVVVYIILIVSMLNPIKASIATYQQNKIKLVLVYFILLGFPIFSGIFIPIRLKMLIKRNIKNLQWIRKALKTEKEVEKILKDLSDEYSVYRNISFGYGDIDAVVVGPTGIFVIEVKYNKGLVSHDGYGRITVIDGIEPKKNYRKQVIGESIRLKRYLDEETNEKVWVFPVLVFPFASVMKGTVLENKNDNYKVPVLGKEEVLQYIYQHEKEHSLKKIEKCKQAMDKFIENMN